MPRCVVSQRIQRNHPSWGAATSHFIHAHNRLSTLSMRNQAHRLSSYVSEQQEPFPRPRARLRALCYHHPPCQHTSSRPCTSREGKLVHHFHETPHVTNLMCIKTGESRSPGDSRCQDTDDATAPTWPCRLLNLHLQSAAQRWLRLLPLARPPVNELRDG